TANVGRVPRGVLGTEPVDGALGQSVPIEQADRSRARAGTPRRQAEAELHEFIDPVVAQVGSRNRDDLVGPGVGPGSAIPRLPDRWPGLLAGVVTAPLRFVSVDVRLDLLR